MRPPNYNNWPSIFWWPFYSSPSWTTAVVFLHGPFIRPFTTNKALLSWFLAGPFRTPFHRDRALFPRGSPVGGSGVVCAGSGSCQHSASIQAASRWQRIALSLLVCDRRRLISYTQRKPGVGFPTFRGLPYVVVEHRMVLLKELVSKPRAFRGASHNNSDCSNAVRNFSMSSLFHLLISLLIVIGGGKSSGTLFRRSCFYSEHVKCTHYNKE